MIATYVFVGKQWFWTSNRFPSGAKAKEAFDTLENVGETLNEVGFFRYGTAQEPGVYITAVGLDRDCVQIAENILGRRNHLPEMRTLEALIARRIRFVADLEERGAPGGSHVIRRGTRGAIVHPDGTLDEQIGQG